MDHGLRRGRFELRDLVALDPVKLHRQIAQFGTSVQGMPPLEVSRGTDGELVINNGVTRATCDSAASVPVQCGRRSCLR